MVKFDEVKKGYSKEQVDGYIKTLSTEYEKMLEENKTLEEELERAKAEKAKADNSNQDNTHSEAIAAALINAELTGKQVVMQAQVEANRISAVASQEVNEIRGKKDVALEEIRQIVERLQTILTDK